MNIPNFYLTLFDGIKFLAVIPCQLKEGSQYGNGATKKHHDQDNPPSYAAIEGVLLALFDISGSAHT
ncbi:hypothetical protein VIBR0546_08852 [Vibrio brasiliensis LMG 20546]|uniref:Uncharacterized protein n=1 Tax=Vibrio brasiliensis LMG 20546 TaxID=945543 RepID=E8LPP9_9VIBR|nr:hypothetical protein VIBR0546_08852 [Vibrio brasiliensis LMG 20546]